MGEKIYESGDQLELYASKYHVFVVIYICNNCREQHKIFALRGLKSDSAAVAVLYKVGEYPPFGPPISSRLISLIGPDRDYFLKGRRAEFQRLGVGAFAYYRRVIENQKDRIFDQIIRVAERVSAKSEIIEDLSRAKQETQFSKAVGAVKHGLPDSLLVNGQNR